MKLTAEPTLAISPIHFIFLSNLHHTSRLAVSIASCFEENLNILDSPTYLYRSIEDKHVAHFSV